MRLVVLAVAAMLILFLVYRQIDRWRGQGITVWVAATDLPAGTQMGAQHLVSMQARARNLSQDVVANPATIGSVALVRPKTAGQLFVESDFRRLAPDPGPGLLGAVPEGRVLMTYELPDLPIAALSAMLRQGDRFDIMAGRGREEPLHMAHDVVFLGRIAPPEAESSDDEDDGGVGRSLADSFASAAKQTIDAPAPVSAGPSPLLIGVRPEDVRRLVWARSANLSLFVVFHGSKEAQAGELLPFPPEPRARADQVELILGANRSRVSLSDPQ